MLFRVGRSLRAGAEHVLLGTDLCFQAVHLLHCHPVAKVGLGHVDLRFPPDLLGDKAEESKSYGQAVDTLQGSARLEPGC